MALNIERLEPTFFARVTGVDLTGRLDDAMIAEINDALLAHAVLHFPDQPVTDDQQEAFSLRYGPLEESFNNPEDNIARLSNRNPDGSLRDPESRQSRFLRANQLWHSDSTIFQAPARISFLSARAVPPVDGETEWADLHAAYEALPAALKAQADSLIVEHDFQNSRRRMGHEFTEAERKRWPPICHPLVRVHEETGEKALYVGSQAVRVVGWPDDQGKALIEELYDFVSQERFVHTHKWAVGDFVMWDNRRVNHRGRPWDETKYERALHRTTVRGRGPTMENGHPVNEFERLRQQAA
jgi:alpha-ketoglutarate-dependent 2,4-dichlorophenoxyacetate dioxygenase